ncbi:ABC transporter substrate-binding protein [Enterovirga rhinocerotis]|uniref:Branched-chain amino acid transport system substrate-binding protein n=1 Tax=Enterovirga rhinocerotis TaxID=1339210 RepID=A0A4R7BT06_9HYPH|nr:ABC transporter substrate-binding protein [Enterovirga rhinocerotis]TDR87237.1 branched-chain amino acid transport system substrate-binding protein [Enterovirga rhinocerotis]
MRTGLTLSCACLALGFTLAGATVATAQQPVRIGVIDDLSGMYSANGGPNTVLATQMAVEDFGGKVLDRPIEVISADHQNKPDIGSTLARQFVDERGVVAVVNGGASSVGLAIQTYAKQRKFTTLISGGYAANFSGTGCSPYGTQWAPSTGELANAVAEAVVKGGGKKWYLLTADYVFGHNLSADATKAVKAAGGEVVGETRHPLGTADMSSPLLTAQASGADVIGLANAGPDLVNTIKQAREFGVSSKLISMLVFANNVVALGLDTAQGLRFAVNFYWDANDDTRAWAKRFMARNGNQVPTMGHALAYIATTHYLRAVAEAKTTEPAAVDKAMKALPITGGMLKNPRIQSNGRVTMDMYLVEVKSPKDSKGPADIYRIVDTIPAEKLFLSPEKSGCPHTAG